MRIRKNAKNISSLLYTNTNVPTTNNVAADECLQQKNYNVCELNQSPWDIITFPSSNSSSSFHQIHDYEINYNVNVAGNGSSIGSVGDYESVASKTMRLGESNKVDMRKKDCGETLGFKKKGSINNQEEIKLCGETDEIGWQCGNVVTKANTMCDYHISELQNYGVWTIKKKSRHGPVTGARPHRAKKQPTTNPHEFYYYSGFGPSWGKKRGVVGTISSDIDSDTSEQEEKRKRLIDMSKTEPMEIDQVDDDDDDDDNDEKVKLVTLGKKRMRKPVKERSLKSLM